MTNYRALAFVAAVGLIGAGIAQADAWDKKTTITIDQPMQLPNMTLQPGTYVIRLADLDSNRHVVQFFNKDENQLIQTVLAIPNERVRPTGKSVFAFWETPAGQPPALRAWFYPGDNFGQEFAYPKDEAARITANNKGATVPVNDEKAKRDDRSTTTASVAEPVRPTPAPAVESTQPAPPAESNPPAVQAQASQPEPAREPVEVAAAPQQNASPAAATPIPADSTSDAQRVSRSETPDALPQTASSLPLIELIGLLSLFAAFAVNVAYRRG